MKFEDTELSPCPTCGSKSSLELYQRYSGHWIVLCGDCYDGQPLAVFRSEAAAARAWNEEATAACDERSVARDPLYAEHVRTAPVRQMWGWK